MATMKMVRRAATEERTGEVREMRIRKDPENAESMLAYDPRWNRTETY